MEPGFSYTCRGRGRTRPDVGPGCQPEILLISGRGSDIETLLHRIANANVQATKYRQSIPVGPFDHLRVRENFEY